jgi:hypothetical protein
MWASPRCGKLFKNTGQSRSCGDYTWAGRILTVRQTMSLPDFSSKAYLQKILVDLIKHKIMAGQANASDVIQELVDDKEAAVVIMKRK